MLKKYKFRKFLTIKSSPRDGVRGTMKPTLPQGTRDFSENIIRKRKYIFDTIREVFELYGFQPLKRLQWKTLKH